MRYEAPAKVNLSLLVSPRDQTGLHPIRSLVQAIEWCDVLEVVPGDEDSFDVDGLEVPTGKENLVVRALEELRSVVTVPPLSVSLTKVLPVESGLGGGSADAAAMLVAGAETVPAESVSLTSIAAEVGADVTFPLTGGTAEVTGYGGRVHTLTALAAFAIAVVVPEFGLSTPQVYRRWDELGGPQGFEIPDRFLPPELRNSYPIRNDLYRAAVDVEPALADFVSDTGRLWDAAVLMTGSGSACFGFFSSVEEAAEAAALARGTRAHAGVALRPHGVRRIEDED